MSSPGSFGRGRGYGVRVGIDYNQWQKRAEGLALEARRKEQRIQQLYDSIREYERRTEAFGGQQLPIDLAQNLRNSIQQYEQLSGLQYEGRGREIAGLMPFRGAPRISSSVSTGGSRGPSAASQARQTERAAIRSQKQQEGQQLKDAKWLSNYETKRADLEKRSKSSGVSAQENYNAQQELIKLEIERQRRETRMPDYETPAQVARRESAESLTTKREAEMGRKNDVLEANQQLDRLIESLDQNTDADAIAQINKLRPQLDKGASPESIIKQAQATAKSAENTRERKNKDTIAREKRSADEWNRRESVREESRIDVEDRAYQRNKESIDRKTQGQLQGEVNVITYDIIRLRGEVDSAQQLISVQKDIIKNPQATPAEKTAAQEQINKVDIFVQRQNVTIAGLQSELKAKETRLGSAPSGGAAPAGGGGQQSYRSAEDVRAAFASGELSEADAVRILREQFGYE